MPRARAVGSSPITPQRKSGVSRPLHFYSILYRLITRLTAQLSFRLAGYLSASFVPASRAYHAAEAAGCSLDRSIFSRKRRPRRRRQLFYSFYEYIPPPFRYHAMLVSPGKRRATDYSGSKPILALTISGVALPPARKAPRLRRHFGLPRHKCHTRGTRARPAL